jgi:aspartyl/asparaginyl beta-hydroxylase (cupin superfamily)
MKVLKTSPTVASNLHFKDNIHFIWLQKIQFSKNMMEDLKIFFKEFIKNHTSSNLKIKKSGMNID